MRVAVPAAEVLQARRRPHRLPQQGVRVHPLGGRGRPVAHPQRGLRLPGRSGPKSPRSNGIAEDALHSARAASVGALPCEPGDRPPWRGSRRRLRAHAPPSQVAHAGTSRGVRRQPRPRSADAPGRRGDAADAARFPGRRTDVAPDLGTVASSRRTRVEVSGSVRRCDNGRARPRARAGHTGRAVLDTPGAQRDDVPQCLRREATLRRAP